MSTMSRKSSWLSVIYFLVTLSLLPYYSELPSRLLIVLAVIWVALFPILRLFVMRCPYCGKSAYVKPSGGMAVSVGHRCRWCQRSF